MPKIKTSFTIESSTDRHLTRTAHKFGFSRSHLVQEILGRTLPQLEGQDRFTVWAQGVQVEAR